MSSRQWISTGFVGAVILGPIALGLWLFLLLAAVYRPTPSMIFLVLFIGAMLCFGTVLWVKERRAERAEFYSEQDVRYIGRTARYKRSESESGSRQEALLQ